MASHLVNTATEVEVGIRPWAKVQACGLLTLTVVADLPFTNKSNIWITCPNPAYRNIDGQLSRSKRTLNPALAMSALRQHQTKSQNAIWERR